MLLKNANEDVYVGYRSTPETFSFLWPTTSTDLGPGVGGINQFVEDFTRWGIGQPDGPVALTNQDYCVVLYVGNTKQLGMWYDVPCNETHKYICSMDADPSLDSVQTPRIQDICPEGWYGYSDETCFKLVSEREQWATYAQAKEMCLNGSESGYSLATVRDGFESALIDVLMNLEEVPYAWIGLSSRESKGEFKWESGYPIEYTNWGTNEPSARSSEGCARARDEGEGWDDTTCEDTAPYVCRYDKTRPQFPTADPALVGLVCPDEWLTYDGSGSCYYFGDPNKETWGVANFRCMQNYNSRLVSISSSAENEFVYTNALEAAQNEKFDRSVWIGLTRTLSTRGDWGTFAWIDGKTELNYASWSREEPNGDKITNMEVPETCVLMSLDEGGTWADKICQSQKLRFVCEMTKQVKYDESITRCSGTDGDQFVKEGDYCYAPSSRLEGLESESMTWLDAENICRKRNGNLVSILNQAEQNIVRELSTSYARSYWIGFEEENGVYKWSDNTFFDSSTFSEFPSLPPQNTAGEEECGEILIWQNGIWGTTACGNALPFICKRRNSKPTTMPQLVRYPLTGSCPPNYFQLGTMCFRFEDDGKTWVDARDDCRNNFDGTLATISNPGQQAFLTSLIKVLDGQNVWIGLNSIGRHSQYHWTDGSPFTYRNWREGAPSNTLPFSDPNSAACITMMSAEDYAGEWNDGRCNDMRPYLCQAPLGNYGATPPAYPGDDCPDSRYTPYSSTCFLMESTQTETFAEAKAKCVEKKGNLMSAADRFELALMTALLYQDTMTDGDEAWIGMQRHSTTKAFVWIDNWPISSTRWGPNEPSNAGDCVAITRDGFWAVRNCDEEKYYFCEYPTGSPPKPPPAAGEVCSPGYTEVPGTDKCVLFKTTTLPILKDQVTYTCQVDHMGGVMPSIHNKAQEDFIKQGAAEVYGANAQIWLGIDRKENGQNKWTDRTTMDYTNWMDGEPNPVGDGNTQCVALNLNSGWADVDCENRANFICMRPKISDNSGPDDSGITQVSSWALLILGSAVAMATRC